MYYNSNTSSEMDYRALQTVKRRTVNRYGKSKLKEDGIWLSVRFRNRQDSYSIADAVNSVHGQAVVMSVRKTRTARHAGDLTWVVEFTITLNADNYLKGFIDLRTLRTLETL